MSLKISYSLIFLFDNDLPCMQLSNIECSQNCPWVDLFTNDDNGEKMYDMINNAHGITKVLRPILGWPLEKKKNDS